MDRAEEIAAVRAHARDVLDAKHAAREVTLGACRQIDPELRRRDPRRPARGVRRSPRS